MIFKQCNPRTKAEYKRFIKGIVIRIDLYNNYPLWKVKELHTIKNYRVCQDKGHTGHTKRVVYIEIL